MKPPPGGVTALPCAICNGVRERAVPCQQVHPDHCHWCYRTSLSGSYDAREHRNPAEPLVLTQRELAAVRGYTAHLVRTVGAAPLVELLTQEEAP